MPPLSIFALHLLMTLKPPQGKGLQQGACVSSTLAVRPMSAAAATILLIEEGIVESSPRKQVTLQAIIWFTWSDLGSISTGQ